MKVYINGKLADEGDAKISVFDRGFLLGEGVFETMRVYRGVIFLVERHIDRLIEGAKALDFSRLPEHAAIVSACENVVAANNLEHARVRVTLTAGTAGGSPTLVITATPYTGYEPDLYKRGMSAITVRGLRVSNNLIHTLKSTSYLSSVMARREASALGCEEAILINEMGNVAEGSFTNIFGVKAGMIYTPPVEDGLLPGITREHVVEVAVRADFPVFERSIQARALSAMDEVFVTNSLLGVMPLISIDGVKVSEGAPGPVTHDIMRLYERSVEAAIANPRT